MLAITTRASTLSTSMPTSDTRAKTSMTTPLSRIVVTTSARVLSWGRSTTPPPAALDCAAIVPSPPPAGWCAPANRLFRRLLLFVFLVLGLLFLVLLGPGLLLLLFLLFALVLLLVAILFLAAARLLAL